MNNGADKTGGVQMNLGDKSEAKMFLDRCLNDIKTSPDSRTAGLSSVLLSTICFTSPKMQTVIAKHVFCKIASDLEGELPLATRVAYLTVLTSLLDRACKLKPASAKACFIANTI